MKIINYFILIILSVALSFLVGFVFSIPTLFFEKDYPIMANIWLITGAIFGVCIGIKLFIKGMDNC
jgi:ABC-type branched-subunit amino acid transport system permease subunit